MEITFPVLTIDHLLYLLLINFFISGTKLQILVRLLTSSTSKYGVTLTHF